jgi:exonuclease-1
MGISNLLQNLKFCAERLNVSQFHGQVLCVDVSSWIMKGAYCCAEELNEPNGEDTAASRYCHFVTDWCDKLLRYAGVEKIVLVFDGQRCPLKADTNAERRRKAAEALAEARRLKAAGKGKEAQRMFQQCCKNTPRMQTHVKRAVRRRFAESQVQLVQSPFEADSQMVRLCADGVCDAIVSEDSDILVYAATSNHCVPVIYKLDKQGGDCDVICLDWLLPNSHNGRDPTREKRLAGQDGAVPGHLRMMAK